MMKALWKKFNGQKFMGSCEKGIAFVTDRGSFWVMMRP
jgi:hypothetical protein